MVDILDVIEEELCLRSITIKDFSNMCNISSDTMYRWFERKNYPPINKVEKMLETLNLEWIIIDKEVSK